MKCIILKVEYDGSNYAGWQLQNNAQTVQGEIENAIFAVTRQKMRLNGSGRTDSGVHAAYQVAHIDINEPLNINEKKFTKAVNAHLPKDIRIKRTVYTDKDFHSRFDATNRQYTYRLRTNYSVFHRNFVSFIRYRIDADLLFECASIFKGTHDFTTFSKFNAAQKNHLCRVEFSEWEEESPCQYKFTIRANHFLYGMVRSLVGAMIDAARNKRSIEELKTALEKKDRKLNSPLAPPEGLILERVFYDDDPFGGTGDNDC